MPSLSESSEWLLINELGRLLDQRKAPYQGQDTGSRVRPNAELIEIELRRAFMIENPHRNLNSMEFSQCQEKLTSLCSLLEALAWDRGAQGGPQEQPYSRLRALAAYLRCTSKSVDLVNGPNETLFRLPSDADKLDPGELDDDDCLRIVSEYNDGLNRLLIAPVQQPAPKSEEREGKKGAWKEFRMRNKATSVLRTLFEHFKCETPHNVLLKLAEIPNERSARPSLQLMLPKCPELELWQEARCDSLHLDETSRLSIHDLCIGLRDQHGRGKALVLYIEKCRLFGSWANATFPEAGASSRESLLKLIQQEAFKPISQDIDAILKGATSTRFGTKEKRALAVKLGYCLMDFFDADLSSETICFLDLSTSRSKQTLPYLAFSSDRPWIANSYKFQMGHPVLLSFAKLLLEMDSGRPIDLEISPDSSQNIHVWANLLNVVDQLEMDRNDSYLEAIRGCLLAHQKIAKALDSRDLDRNDADSRIRKKLYREVVRKLEQAQSVTQTARKRRRSESPPARDDGDGFFNGSSKQAKRSREMKQFAPRLREQPIPESQPQRWIRDTDAAERRLENPPPLSSNPKLDEQPGSANQYGDGNHQYNNFGAGIQKNVDDNSFEAKGDQKFGFRRLAPPTSIEPEATKAPKNGRTFRVRGVPLDWDAGRLQSFLAEREGSAGAIVKSLAHEIHGRSRTATVTFQNVPLGLQTLPTNQTWSILLPKPSDKHSTRDHYLTLDNDFLGITTLYAPSLEDHKVDVIAISGLGGHAFGSFKERGGNYMWLRDSLPYDITREGIDDPMARVIIYGYESSVAQSKSMQNLEDLATSFHTSLRALANTTTTRPIILVAHSLGGLIIKQALITLSKSKNEDDVKLVRAVYGIVFFGVPHDGMDISSLIPMVGDGPNRFLIESIGRLSSQILSIQQREFHTALGGEGDSEIVCFYETVESPTAQKDEHGNWTMAGPTAVLVTKSSATHCRSWEDGPEHICAVARTHSNMVKFGPQDHEYDNACERLKGLARRALTAPHRIQGVTPASRELKGRWISYLVSSSFGYDP